MKPHIALVSGGSCLKRSRQQLEVSAVRKLFHSDIGCRMVLDDLNFNIGKGEMVCILGRSGCGKTTLLKILSGFIPPTSGSLALNGQPITAPGPERCMVFQEDALFPWLTVRENVAFGLRGNDIDSKWEVERFLDLVGLGEFGDYLPNQISGGMKQRVSLARVLIMKPKVLLMDEPFGALDMQTREEMQDLLLSLWKIFANTILFVTHDVYEAVTLADRILLMDKDPGRIRSDIAVPLPRPRNRCSNRFTLFCRKIDDAIKA